MTFELKSIKTNNNNLKSVLDVHKLLAYKRDLLSLQSLFSNNSTQFLVCFFFSSTVTKEP